MFTLARITTLLMVLATAAVHAQPEAARSVADLTRLAAIEPVRIQMDACSRLYPQQSAGYAAAVDRITALVDSSLQQLGTQRAAELKSQAPDALFMFQDGLLGQYRTESESLAVDRCEFLAKDIQSLSETEFVTLLGEMVGQFARASSAYRDGITEATR